MIAYRYSYRSNIVFFFPYQILAGYVGSSFLCLWEFHGSNRRHDVFDKSTVSRVINNVTNALVLHKDRFIKWPNPAETAESKQNFFLRGGFPGVIGCVDGTHVRIQAPSEDEAVYVNRKGWHSVNVQAICDHEGTIVLISYQHSFSFLIIQ